MLLPNTLVFAQCSGYNEVGNSTLDPNYSKGPESGGILIELWSCDLHGDNDDDDDDDDNE